MSLSCIQMEEPHCIHSDFLPVLTATAAVDFYFMFKGAVNIVMQIPDFPYN